MSSSPLIPSPWNLDVMDEEFFFDAADSFIHILLLQKCCDAHDPHIDASGELYSLHHASSEIPVSQEHHDIALDSLS